MAASNCKTQMEIDKDEETCKKILSTPIPKAVLHQMGIDSNWGIIFSEGAQIRNGHDPLFNLSLKVHTKSKNVNAETPDPTLDISIKFGHKKKGLNQLALEALYIIGRRKYNLSFDNWAAKRNLSNLGGNFIEVGFQNSTIGKIEHLTRFATPPVSVKSVGSVQPNVPEKLPSKIGYEEILCFDDSGIPSWKYMKRELTEEETQKLRRLPFKKMRKFAMIRAASINFPQILKDLTLTKENPDFLYELMVTICNSQKIRFKFESFDWPKLKILEEVRDQVFVILDVNFPSHFRISERTFFGNGLNRKEAMINATKDFLKLLQLNTITATDKGGMTEEEVKELQKEFDRNQRLQLKL